MDELHVVIGNLMYLVANAMGMVEPTDRAAVLDLVLSGAEAVRVERQGDNAIVLLFGTSIWCGPAVHLAGSVIEESGPDSADFQQG